MLKQPVILPLKRQRSREPLLFLLFGEVDFKRVKTSSVVRGLGIEAGQVELEGEGDARIERECSEMGDRGVERGSPLISGSSEH